MGNKQKILLCGDVEGKFDTLFNRVATINKKSGPFDALFCVGNFFGINNKELEKYRLNVEKVPISTYVLGPNCSEHVNLYANDGEICENVYYLGKRGVFTNSRGLKVAYISGMAGENGNEFEYSNKDILELYNSCIKGNPSFRGIDLLLTSQWPSGVTQNSPNDKPKLTINKASDYCSWISMKLRPRYHIAGLEGMYYERAPFRSPSLGEHDTTLEIATRFIGLARVGNRHKDRWLYALNLTPLSEMKVADLYQKTTDETECPYNFDELEQKVFKKKRKQVTGNQYFYDTTAPDEPTLPKKQKKDKVTFDQSKCWFCLASPSLEKHLIVTIGTHAYLALAKGGLVEEHFLICPIEHHQHSLNLNGEILSEITKFKQALFKFYERKGQVPVIFERNYKTSHMQLQVIPIPKQAAREVKEIFQADAEAQGFRLQELGDQNRLDQVVQVNHPYFLVELPNGETLYTRIQKSFPLNFGREVLATEAILNLPEKTDWRECILSKEDEQKLVEKIRKDFQPFDFTN